MKKSLLKSLSLIFLGIAIIFGVLELASATSYQPMKHKQEYSINSEELYLLDLDQDGQMEFYACTYSASHFKSYINVYGDNGEFLWNTWIQGKKIGGCASISMTIHTLCIDDINGNEDLDIIYGAKVRGGKINTNPITYIERETYETQPYPKRKNVERWEYGHVGGVATEIISADMDNNGIKEILVASADGCVYVLDIAGNLRDKYELDGSVYDIFTSDVDDDGTAEIVAGTYNSVYLIDGGVKWGYPINNRVSRVYARDVNDDQKAEIIATDGDILYVIDPQGNVKWKKELGEITGVAASDMDNDTSVEILAAVGDSIKAFSPDGSFKWEYPVGEGISSMLLLSENELLINTQKKIYLLETDNRYRLNQTAYEYYLRANEYYVPPNDDCESAMPLVNKAMEIFTEINNTQGIMDCDMIIAKCKDKIEEKELADEYYSIARNSYNSAEGYLGKEDYDNARVNYDNAKNHAQRAMSIYDRLGYKYGIIQCDGLLRDIKKKDYEIKLKEADKYYSEACWYYTKDNWGNSTPYIKKARDIYVELNHSEGIDNCDLLSLKIERGERKKTADNLYSLAREKYQLHEYNDALASVEQALAIYLELNLTGEISQSNSLRDLAENYITAGEYYALAEQHYELGEYENATYYANESKKIYTELENYKKIVVCESLLKDIKEKEDERRMFELIKIAAGVIILIVIVVAIFFFKKRSKK